MRQNIDVCDFKLTGEEIEYLASFHSARTIPFLPLKSHKYYPFDLEF